jgi:hypothetical protein
MLEIHPEKHQFSPGDGVEFDLFFNNYLLEGSVFAGGSGQLWTEAEWI